MAAGDLFEDGLRLDAAIAVSEVAPNGGLRGWEGGRVIVAKFRIEFTESRKKNIMPFSLITLECPSQHRAGPPSSQSSKTAVGSVGKIQKFGVFSGLA